MLELPNLKGEEVMYLREVTRDMTDSELRSFISIYRGKRKDPKMMIILTLAGFVGFAGAQRFIKDEIGMGLLYFVTVGFCGIGTILDLINNENSTLDYNRTAALDASNTVYLLSE